MEKKIIFFDIDGTLSDERSMIVPTSTIDAMHAASQNGHILIINTGRGASTIESTIRNLPVDGFIYGCGTHIEFHDETIILHEFDDNLKEKIKQLSIECHLENILEGNYAAYFPEEFHDNFVKEVYTRYKENDFNILTYNKETKPKFQKMAMQLTPQCNIKRFKEELEDDLHFIERDINFLEVIPKAYNKATGIKELIDYLHIDHKNTFAIGDSMNDIEMLSYVHTSIAMGNSKKELFPLVSYVTTDINDNGIFNALKHFKII